MRHDDDSGLGGMREHAVAALALPRRPSVAPQSLDDFPAAHVCVVYTTAHIMSHGRGRFSGGRCGLRPLLGGGPSHARRPPSSLAFESADPAALGRLRGEVELHLPRDAPHPGVVDRLERGQLPGVRGSRSRSGDGVRCRGYAEQGARPRTFNRPAWQAGPSRGRNHHHHRRRTLLDTRGEREPPPRGRGRPSPDDGRGRRAGSACPPRTGAPPGRRCPTAAAVRSRSGNSASVPAMPIGRTQAEEPSK